MTVLPIQNSRAGLNIVARVSGYLDKIAYEEGDLVKAIVLTDDLGRESCVQSRQLPLPGTPTQ
jgi:hypothetical protein